MRHCSKNASPHRIRSCSASHGHAFRSRGFAAMEIRPCLPGPNQESPPHNAALLRLSARFLRPRPWPGFMGLPKPIKAASLTGAIRNSPPSSGTCFARHGIDYLAPAGATKGTIQAVRSGFVRPDCRTRTLRKTEPSTPLPKFHDTPSFATRVEGRRCPTWTKKQISSSMRAWSCRSRRCCVQGEGTCTAAYPVSMTRNSQTQGNWKGRL